MNQFRLRGTWEDDPAPLPFPGSAAGRDAGARGATQDREPAATTEQVIAGVDKHLDRMSFKLDELRDMLTPFDGGGDPPSAA